MAINRIKSNAGLTLIELMVAVALLGIIALGMVGIFGNISKGIQYSRARTLASNLAQEQMQVLKQKAFNKVLVTTATMYLSGFGSTLPYDPGYYPPETITEGGIEYQRYTHIQVADENSGSLSYLGAVADTGMKAILVSVVWAQGSDLKKLQVRNILADPDTTQTTSVIRGQVTISPGSTAISGALVTVAENIGWADFTDASGNFVINLSPGSYRLACTARGYFSQYINISVAANGTATQNFSMQTMASGTLRGTVWLNTHPVISQVVGSNQESSGFCSEFVEVYNPSTFTWIVASGASTPATDLKYQGYSNAFPSTIAMNYINMSIPPRGYYIFANTTTVTVAGVAKTADAVYKSSNPGFPDLIPTSGGSCGSGSPDSDSVGIADTASGTWIDRFGWKSGTHVPNLYEGTPLTMGTVLRDGEQYVRKTSTSGVAIGPGRAYDSGSNNVDFVSGYPAAYPPRNTGNTDLLIAGTPAVGAYITATDGLSQVSTASSVGNPPYAEFILTSVATGTWNVLIASSSYVLEIDTVAVTAGATTYIPNATTVPSWPVSGYNIVNLSSAATQGYVCGNVTDALGLAIGPTAITVGVGAATTLANTSNGTYLLPLTAGTYDITANPNNLNSSYVSQTSATITVPLGQIVSNVDFTLSQGGRIRGFATRDGTNALPGVSFIASDASGNSRDGEVSGSDGRFLLINLATGSYLVEPVLGSGETASPASVAVSITAGANVSAGTFTITGTFGRIRGNVSVSGQPIRTGIVVIATTATISGAPPTLSYNSITGTGYYLTNSYEDGSYNLDVRGSTSTTYRVYGYYTTFSGTTPVITSRSLSSISVGPGLTVSGQDLSW